MKKWVVAAICCAMLIALGLFGARLMPKKQASAALPKEFYAPETLPVRGDDIRASDYADPGNWALLPEHPDKPVDVFFIHGSVWKRGNGHPYICGIDHLPMRERAKLIYWARGSAMETVGNMYQPFYRQFDATFLLSNAFEDQRRLAGGVPATDILAAFDEYIKHHNGGRPFILFGHSQGAMMIKEILFSYMKEHPDVLSRMVAAYAIGYSVTEAELAENPHLKFAQGRDDTGVIISYSTEAPELPFSNPVVEPGAIAINPVSWTLSEAPASAEQSLGALIATSETTLQRIDHLANATVDLSRGTVVCSSVDPDDYRNNSAIFPEGIYHAHDIAFYYYDLRQNAQDRADAFLGK